MAPQPVHGGRTDGGAERGNARAADSDREVERGDAGERFGRAGVRERGHVGDHPPAKDRRIELDEEDFEEDLRFRRRER